jgi:hypothetical protein
LKYFKVKQTSRTDQIFGAVRPVSDHKENLSGFVGRNQLDSLPFGYMRLESKAGLAIEIKKELIEAVEEFDYETCQEYQKVAYEG